MRLETRIEPNAAEINQFFVSSLECSAWFGAVAGSRVDVRPKSYPEVICGLLVVQDGLVDLRHVALVDLGDGLKRFQAQDVSHEQVAVVVAQAVEQRHSVRAVRVLIQSIYTCWASDFF